MAKTLADIISGKAELSEKEKKALKKAMGISSKGASSDSTDIGELDSQTTKVIKGREYYEILQKQALAVGDIIAAEDAERIILKDKLGDKIEELDLLTKNINKQDAIKMILDGQVDSLTDNKEVLEALESIDIKRLKLLDKINKSQKKFGNLAKEVADTMAESLGISNFLTDSWIGKVVQLGKELQASGDDLTGNQAKMIQAFKQAFSVTNLLYSVILKIAEGTIKAATAADKAQAAFAGATGAGREFADEIQSAGQHAMGFGVSMEDAGKAAQGLFTGTTNFVNVSQDMREQMIANTAELEKIGVSAEQSGQLFQFMNLNLGMTAEQSLEATNQLAMMGTELGISSKQMTKDFQESMGTLAVYGPRAVGVFKNLSSAAKVAGIETSKLLSIAAKFDTFQGAAETVGKLNALLGTQLSTTQMLMMTEDERIETLIGTVQAQGTAFKDMGRFQQKAVAAAAGITDMNEAQRIFGMNMSQYGEYQQEMAESADAQEKLTDAIRGTQTVTNKLKAIGAEFIIQFQPMLEMLHSVLDYTLKLFKSFSPEAKRTIMMVVFSIASLTLAFKILGPIMAATTAIMGVAGGAAATGGTTMIGGLAAMGAAAGAAAAELAILGAVLAGAYLAYKAVVGIGSLFEPGPEPSQAEKEAEGIIKYKAQMTPFVSADLANLALIAAGRAKSAMQDAFVMAQKIDITNNLEGLFPKVIQLILDDGTKLDTRIAKIHNH